LLRLGESARHGTALIVAQQNLDAPLGLAQSLLALARQANALLEKLQTLFQRQVAAFELLNNLFQRFQRRFKSARLFLLFGHLFFFRGLAEFLNKGRV
jgi:hypothetical protein